MNTESESQTRVAADASSGSASAPISFLACQRDARAPESCNPVGLRRYSSAHWGGADMRSLFVLTIAIAFALPLTAQAGHNSGGNGAGKISTAPTAHNGGNNGATGTPVRRKAKISSNAISKTAPIGIRVPPRAPPPWPEHICGGEPCPW
jgi:hypothetical protein